MNKNEEQRGEQHSLHSSALHSSPSLRVFFAIRLPAEIRARAEEHMADLRSLMPDVRAGWERGEKLHITMKFLGNVEQPRVAALGDAATRAAQSVSAFGLRIEGAGSFPPRGPARVLWLGVADDSGALARLHRRLEEECEGMGFAREARPFHPHITLARLRRPAGAQRLAALHREKGFASSEVAVAHLVLMRSELGPGGSRYTVLSSHPLSGE
ncbi:MAG TPA: RNA 2',3'-cyclic phosphodiesterase [Pyrinomonadaceae bacterium]|jgi:2'-5' RNA ligase